MILKNKDIIKYYEELSASFKDNTKYLPAKISFIIQKNIKMLKELSEEIYIEIILFKIMEFKMKKIKTLLLFRKNSKK